MKSYGTTVTALDIMLMTLIHNIHARLKSVVWPPFCLFYSSAFYLIYPSIFCTQYFVKRFNILQLFETAWFHFTFSVFCVFEIFQLTYFALHASLFNILLLNTTSFKTWSWHWALHLSYGGQWAMPMPSKILQNQQTLLHLPKTIIKHFKRTCFVLNNHGHKKAKSIAF